MHMCICTYIYTYTHICTQIHTHMYGCIHKYISSDMYTYMYRISSSLSSLLSLSFSSECWQSYSVFSITDFMFSNIHSSYYWLWQELKFYFSFNFFILSHPTSCSNYISGCSLLLVFHFCFLDTMSSSLLLRQLNRY